MYMYFIRNIYTVVFISIIVNYPASDRGARVLACAGLINK